MNKLNLVIIGGIITVVAIVVGEILSTEYRIMRESQTKD